MYGRPEVPGLFPRVGPPSRQDISQRGERGLGPYPRLAAWTYTAGPVGIQRRAAPGDKRLETVEMIMHRVAFQSGLLVKALPCILTGQNIQTSLFTEIYTASFLPLFRLVMTSP